MNLFTSLFASRNPSFTGSEFDALRELLECNPEAGTLTWRARSAHWFHADRNLTAEERAKCWNSRCAGKPAFNSLANGYYTGHVFGRPMKAHRVIWAMAHDEWPKQIDHINGDPGDNRISNLRSVTNAENSRNRGLQSNNTSGHQGVHLLKATGRWVAFIRKDRRRRHIGIFGRFEDAVAARKEAERRLGFHENHGRRA